MRSTAGSRGRSLRWSGLVWALGACRIAATPDVEVVQHEEAGRPLRDLLLGEREGAIGQGKCAIAQVYADWCAPCRALRGAMGDEQMKAAMSGVRLVRLEMGAWDTQIREQRPEFDIPILFFVEADGSLGRSIDGSAWGENTVENMAPPLSAWVDDVCGRGATLRR